MVFIDINGVLIKKVFFGVVTSDGIQNYMQKNQKKLKKEWRRAASALASATSSARSLVRSWVLADRASGMWILII